MKVIVNLCYILFLCQKWEAKRHCRPKTFNIQVFYFIFTRQGFKRLCDLTCHVVVRLTINNLKLKPWVIWPLFRPHHHPLISSHDRQSTPLTPRPVYETRSDIRIRHSGYNAVVQVSSKIDSPVCACACVWVLEWMNHTCHLRCAHKLTQDCSNPGKMLCVFVCTVVQ